MQRVNDPSLNIARLNIARLNIATARELNADPPCAYVRRESSAELRRSFPLPLWWIAFGQPLTGSSTDSTRDEKALPPFTSYKRGRA